MGQGGFIFCLDNHEAEFKWCTPWYEYITLHHLTHFMHHYFYNTCTGHLEQLNEIKKYTVYKINNPIIPHTFVFEKLTLGLSQFYCIHVNCQRHQEHKGGQSHFDHFFCNIMYKQHFINKYLLCLQTNDWFVSQQWQVYFTSMFFLYTYQGLVLLQHLGTTKITSILLLKRQTCSKCDWQPLHKSTAEMCL